MGGDYFPKAPIAGAQLAKSTWPELEIVLVGQEQVIVDELKQQGLDASQFDILHADEYVEMNESASQALRSKPNSSFQVGIGAHKAGELDAFLSAGNTGALLATALFGLGLLDGVERPTVGSLYPVNGTYSYLLDVGANIDCKPEFLVKLGVIGSTFMKTMFDIEQPRVALLNIGEEPGKGTQNVQDAYQLFEETQVVNFIGNAEGRDLVDHKADVYVTDGFTGNILLKFAESFYSILKAKAPNDESVEDFNYENVGGLPFLGVKGNVLVGHGISGSEAFKQMISRAKETVDYKLTDQIEAAMKRLKP